MSDDTTRESKSRLRLKEKGKRGKPVVAPKQLKKGEPVRPVVVDTRQLKGGEVSHPTPMETRLLKEGELSRPILLSIKVLPALLRTAARRAARLPQDRQGEVIWVQGDRELAVNVDALSARLADGLIRVLIPVRSDQTGRGTIDVAFAVGTSKEPSGLYASAYRRPNGPPLLVEAWGESLVAFAWQCLLGLITSAAGASGKDARGDSLVPVELTASADGITILPMARYRFTRSSSVVTPIKTRGVA
jgi:hypothetical protein